MKSEKEIQYRADFATFSPEKKRRHLAIALRFALDLMATKAQPAALDVNIIDGECTIGGEA